MSKRFAIAICTVMVLVMLFGCQPKLAQDYPVASNDNQLEITPDLYEGQSISGGETIWEYFFPLYPGFYTIDSFLAEYVGFDKYVAWIKQFRSYDNPHGRDPSEVNIVNAVTELGVSKEDFIKGNQGITYTSEQIDAIYSKDQKLINRVFVNDYALLLGDTVYTADWLACRSVSDYLREGLTIEVVAKYLRVIEDDLFRREYVAIKGNLNKLIGSESPGSEVQSRRELLAPYTPQYYGIDYFIAGLVDQHELEIWMDQFLFDRSESKRGRDVSECTVLNLIRELGIARSDFETAALQNMYTVEHVDAIYSGDPKAINAAFVNRYALLVDGKIYTVEWLARHDLGQYKHEGITADILADYLVGIDATGLSKEHDHISSVLKKMRQ